MNEVHANVARRRAGNLAFDLRRRLDELARGECTEEDFVRDSFDEDATASDSAWYVLSLLDQRYRLGQLPDDLFQSIKSRIALRGLQAVEFGTTVELTPARPSTAAHAPTAVAQPTAVIAAVTAPAVAAESPPVAAKTPAAPSMLAPGRVLRERYSLESVIGSGGMATVFKAVDRCGVLPSDADRRVAVKVLRERINQKPSILIQLRREFYCTQVLAHPNIVKVYELDSDADLAFYTMELLEGERLSDVMARARSAPLPRHYAWAVIRAVGSAVAHAHARNVIHGDLKPQNIMVTNKGEIRVLDFGSSRTSNSADTAATGADAASCPLAATPPYACCEILEGQQPDPRDDLYALACMAYELLSGAHPFQSRNALEARSAQARPLRPPQLRNRQWQAILTGLSWSRENRSVPVSDWLERLGVHIEPQHLPPLNAQASRRLSIPALSGWTSTDWRAIGVPATVALLAVLAMFSFRHVPPRAPLESARHQQAAVALAPVAPIGGAALQPISTAPIVAPASIPAEQSTITQRPPAHPELAADSASTAARTRRTQERAALAALPTVTLSARTYIAGRNANFVEVRVRRSDTSKDAQSFSWWTEAGTAKAGADFTPQTRITRVFSSGRQFATLFIRINANADHALSRTFYVNIGEPGPGTSLGGLTRAAIVLPQRPR